ncbi:hypothetical protein SUGI_1037390 [Cryptomeria japonica]|nr:hypothetical protein SUGI_1037390 [Cryptomeria japonica]
MLVVQIERLLRVLFETVKLFEIFFAWVTKSLKHLSGEPLSQSDQLPVINSQLVMFFLTTIFMEDPIMPHLDALQKDVEIQIHPETKYFGRAGNTWRVQRYKVFVEDTFRVV